MTSRVKKAKIPTAVREQIWIKHMGRHFEGKCPVDWCQNNMTVFEFHAGHNVPESKGGETTVENLIPICARCNLSMGDEYTILAWSKTFRTSSPNSTSSPKSQKTIFETSQTVAQTKQTKRRWFPWFCTTIAVETPSISSKPPVNPLHTAEVSQNSLKVPS